MKIPFYVSNLLSEIDCEDYQAEVIVRRHNLSYVDEQNFCMITSELIEAGWEI